MGDPTRDFFAGLSQRARAVLPARANGRLRVDLIGDNGVEHWFVTFQHGDVRVSREKGDADVIITTDKLLFDRLVAGTEDVVPGVLRGSLDLNVTEFKVLDHFKRLLPDAEGARDPRDLAPAGRRRSR